MTPRRVLKQTSRIPTQRLPPSGPQGRRVKRWHPVDGVRSGVKKRRVNGGRFLWGDLRSAPVGENVVHPRSKPTPAQLAVLRFVADGLRLLGLAPSYREIGAAFGIRSTKGVSDHLHALERKGLLLIRGRQVRGLTLTHAGELVMRGAP